MKKLFALILASVLLLSVPVALGEEGTYSGWDALVQSPTSTITMTVDESDDSFVIVIPATLEVDVATMSGSMEVILKGGYKLYSGSLALYILKDTNGMWLTNSESEDTVNYTLQVETETGSVTWNGTNDQGLFMASVGTSSADKKATLTVTVTEMPTTGTYTDILTFAVR